MLNARLKKTLSMLFLEIRIAAGVLVEHSGVEPSTHRFTRDETPLYKLLPS